jgi:hypothetical protein
MWKDDISLLRNRYQEVIRDNELLSQMSIDERRAMIFDNLLSSDDDRFIMGCWFVVFWEESLSEEDRIMIKNSVLEKRMLFRKFRETMQYYHNQTYVFLILCLILDIEPTPEEIELGMSELSVTPEDKEMAKEFLDRVKYSRMKQN